MYDLLTYIAYLEVPILLLSTGKRLPTPLAAMLLNLNRVKVMLLKNPGNPADIMTRNHMKSHKIIASRCFI